MIVERKTARRRRPIRQAPAVFLLLMMLFVLCSCRNAPPPRKNDFDPWHAEKARSLSVKLPMLDPEKNAVLISAPTFMIDVFDVLQSYTIQEDFGAFERMERMSAGELERFVRDRAMELAEGRLLVAAAKAADISGGSGVSVTPMAGTGLGTVRQLTEYERESEIVQRYWDRLKPGLPVTTEEMRRAYDKRAYATVRYVYLKTSPMPDGEKPAVRRRLEAIRARAKAGEDFAALVRRFSELDTHSSEPGLEIDFYPGLHEKAFDVVAFGLPLGAISDIIELSSGILIMKVLDRKGEWRPFDQLVDQLAGSVREEKFPAFRRAHLEELKSKTKLEIAK
jgi:hypothetical protein